MSINNINFNNPDENGMIVGNIFFPNGYGISLLTTPMYADFEITFYIMKNNNLWVAEMDENLLSISEINTLYNLTLEQINTYMILVQNLPSIII